jgi:uridylate kinase
MKKEVIVLSLGGSLIIPDKVDIEYLKKFKKIIQKNSRKYKFLIGCGGGSIARKYIYALRKAGLNEKFQSFSGISATRMNARFMNYLFGFDPEKGIPHTTGELKKYAKKRDEIAKKFKGTFINLTNVTGLYTADPRKHKNAKFISKISWKEFDKMANKSKYQPGQHFVLDQIASKIILKHKIPTYILGKDLKQLENVLKNKKFKGTLVQG